MATSILCMVLKLRKWYFGISDDENYFSMVNHYLGEGFLLNKWLLDIGAILKLL